MANKSSSNKSTTAKNPAHKNADLPADYETSFAQLEQITTAMEQEELPLDQLLRYYEQGQNLLQHCQELLKEAEIRIQEVTLQQQDSTTPSSTSSSTSVDPAQNDIRLF